MPTISVNKIIALLLFFACFTACELERHAKVDRNRFSFKAGNDTKTFFHNIRSIYYERQTIPNTEVVAYRFKNRPKDSTIFSLSPVIVANWETFDCLLLLEATQYYDSLSIQIRNTNKIDTLHLHTKERIEVLTFSASIYESILAGDTLTFIPGNQIVFQNESEADNFRKVFSDYARLTRIF
ncbi:MAG: hypothetical protein MUF68_01480 [Cyclobacteriaceae bacterium]|jgi:hypothetical protein|nr:hypothetical protein [Cyclobacteriaceae bacterium]